MERPENCTGRLENGSETQEDERSQRIREDGQETGAHAAIRGVRGPRPKRLGCALWGRGEAPG